MFVASSKVQGFSEVEKSKIVSGQSHVATDGRHFYFPKQEAYSDDELPIAEQTDLVCDNSTDPLMGTNDSTQDSSRTDESVRKVPRMPRPLMPLSNMKFEEDDKSTMSADELQEVVFPTKTTGTGLHVYFPNDGIADECYKMITRLFPTAKFILSDSEPQDITDLEEGTCQEEPCTSPVAFKGFSDPNELEVNIIKKQSFSKSTILKSKSVGNLTTANKTETKGLGKYCDKNVPHPESLPKKKRGRPPAKRPQADITRPNTPIMHCTTPKKKRGRPFKVQPSELVDQRPLERNLRRKSVSTPNLLLGVVTQNLEPKKRPGRPKKTSINGSSVNSSQTGESPEKVEKRKRGRPFGSLNKKRSFGQSNIEKDSIVDNSSYQAEMPKKNTLSAVLPGGAVVEIVKETVEKKRVLRKRRSMIDTSESSLLKQKKKEEKTEDPAKDNENETYQTEKTKKIIRKRSVEAKKKSNKNSLADNTTNISTISNGQPEAEGSETPNEPTVGHENQSSLNSGLVISRVMTVSCNEQSEADGSVTPNELPSEPSVGVENQTSVESGLVTARIITGNTASIPTMSCDDQAEADGSVATNELSSEPSVVAEKQSSLESGLVTTSIITGNTTNIPPMICNEQPEADGSVTPDEVQSEPAVGVDQSSAESGLIITSVIGATYDSDASPQIKREPVEEDTSGGDKSCNEEVEMLQELTPP